METGDGDNLNRPQINI